MARVLFAGQLARTELWRNYAAVHGFHCFVRMVAYGFPHVTQLNFHQFRTGWRLVYGMGQVNFDKLYPLCVLRSHHTPACQNQWPVPVSRAAPHRCKGRRVECVHSVVLLATVWAAQCHCTWAGPCNADGLFARQPSTHAYLRPGRPSWLCLDALVGSCPWGHKGRTEYNSGTAIIMSYVEYFSRCARQCAAVRTKFSLISDAPHCQTSSGSHGPLP